jgi:hypothetical protein
MVMIAAAIGAAVKWYGSRHKKADGDAQGDDPIVRAMFRAINDGDVDGLKDHVADDCRIAINSIELARAEHLTNGWELWADAINDIREAYPDIRWALYDELTGKDEGEHKIAIRFVSTVTVDDVVEEFEVAGFGVVDDKKLIEWHQVADLETYNRRRTASGEDAAGN